MENKDNHWSWCLGTDRFRLGYVKLNKWLGLGYPAWSWVHSFYIYRDEGYTQFTLFGLNMGYKWN